MSKRANDLLLHRMSDHLPDDPIIDPVSLIIEMALDAKRAAEDQGIPAAEIDEEIGGMVKFILQGLR
jgi:hypothetical protein